MKVLVDTTIWSLALRRSAPQLNAVQRNLVEEWDDLVRKGSALLVGPIRQELLSEIRRDADFEALRDRLATFPDVPIEAVDYEQAARAFNRCRARGLPGLTSIFSAARSRNVLTFPFSRRTATSSTTRGTCRFSSTHRRVLPYAHTGDY